ncbi:MAG: hypothetical protein ABH846_04620 [Patescibacteria group bacterium]
MCDWCIADRNTRIDAIRRLKARGAFVKPGEILVSHGEPSAVAPDGIYEDRISSQDAMLINIFAIKAELNRVH